MAKVITINIQKGGVGKTTTAHELAANLKQLGKKVLAVDLDQQGNLTKVSGAEIRGYYTIYEVLRGDVVDGEVLKMEDCIQKTPHYDIAISHKNLKGADREFIKWNDIFRLDDLLKQVKDRYDYIVIDTPPNLNILPNMALTAADYVLIPCTAEAFASQGLGQLQECIEEVTDERRGSNRNLKTLGIVFTMFSGRTGLEKGMSTGINHIAQKKHIKIFDTNIRRSVVVGEAQARKTTLNDYSPRSNPAIDYKNLTKEVVKEIEANG